MGDFKSLVDLGKKLLGFRTSAHAVHAANISNASTPQYKAKEISFQVELDKALKNENSLLSAFKDENPWKLSVRKSLSANEANIFGNNVKPDLEMASMTQNSMEYLATVKIISKQLALQRYASTGN